MAEAPLNEVAMEVDSLSLQAAGGGAMDPASDASAFSMPFTAFANMPAPVFIVPAQVVADAWNYTMTSYQPTPGGVPPADDAAGCPPSVGENKDDTTLPLIDVRKVTWFNRAARLMFGRDEPAGLGSPDGVIDLVQREDLGRYINWLQGILSGEETAPFRGNIRTLPNTPAHAVLTSGSTITVTAMLADGWCPSLAEGRAFVVCFAHLSVEPFPPPNAAPPDLKKSPSARSESPALRLPTPWGIVTSLIAGPIPQAPPPPPPAFPPATSSPSSGASALNSFHTENSALAALVKSRPSARRSKSARASTRPWFPRLAESDPTPIQHRTLAGSQPYQPAPTTSACTVPLCSPIFFTKAPDGDCDMAGFLENLARFPMGRMIAEHPWHLTSLGSMNLWSQTLKSATMVALESPQRTCLYWGPDHTMVYNDAYIDCAGRKHPQLLGQTFERGWSELWRDVEPIFDRVMAGVSYSVADDLLLMERNQDQMTLEECYHTWSFSPFRDATGKVEGIWNNSFETTDAVVAARRLHTLHELIQVIGLCRDSASFYTSIMSTLASNPHDLPFVQIYSSEPINTIQSSAPASLPPSDSSPRSRKRFKADSQPTAFDRQAPNYRLVEQGSIGVPEGHACAPKVLELFIHNLASHTASDASITDSPLSSSATRSSGSAASSRQRFERDESLVWPMVEACTLRKSIFLADCADRTMGVEQRGWGDPVRRAVVVPVLANPEGPPTAVAILGLNPRRPFDEPTATFVSLLSRHLATGLASVQAFERESSRAEELERRVAERTRSLAESEARNVQAANQRAQDAEARKRELESFVDITSHELRNPLSAVWQLSELVYNSLKRMSSITHNADNAISAAELRKLKAELADDLECMASVRTVVQHQRRIADDVLQVSKASMGLLTLNKAPFDCSRMLQEVKAAFSAEARHRGIDFTIQPNPSMEGVNVYGDVGRLMQILTNFLTNAFKYGGHSISVSAVIIPEPPVQPPNARRVGKTAGTRIGLEGMEWLMLCVRDQGRGMEPEEMSLLFSRFTQVKPSTDQYGGTGLGLHISLKLIELHDGFIQVESTTEKGSTFSSFLPTKRSRLLPSSPRPGSNLSLSPDTGVGAPGHSRAHQQPSQAPPTPRRPLRVLVVEDNIINLTVLQKQLTGKGCIVTTAKNGQEGLEAILADPGGQDGLDIGIFDNHMPVMDGLTACREIRAAERDGRISRRYPLICVTGNARYEQQQGARQAGFDAVHTKPYNFAELLGAIQALVAENERQGGTGPPVPTTTAARDA